MTHELDGFRTAARSLCRLFREPHNLCPCMRGEPCTATNSYGLEGAMILAAFKREGLLKVEEDRLIERAGDSSRRALQAMAEVGETL